MTTILNTAPHWTGQQAKKTKGLRAMPMASVLTPETADLFTLNTREGYAVPDLTCMLCVGVDGEPWQQSPAKLEAGYDHVGTDGAWGVYEPKPSKTVEFFEVTPALLEQAGISQLDSLCIVGQWGQTIDGVTNLQRLNVGDFVARQLDDHSDQWVVQRAIWLRTYETVTP